MKAPLWFLAMLAAWLLIAGFGWEYATNVYIIDRLKECQDQAQQHLQQVQDEREMLEREALAIEADPFYAEVLLRGTLRWVRRDETPPSKLFSMEAPTPPQPCPDLPASGGSDRAVFTSRPPHVLAPGQLLVANPGGDSRL
jgi:hypothetical protein